MSDEDSWMETFETYLPVCPYCHAETRDPWEFDFENRECMEVDCGACGKPFVIIRNVSINYTTKKPKKQ